MKLSFLEIIRKIKSILLHSDEKDGQKKQNVYKRNRDLDQKGIRIDAHKDNKGDASLVESQNKLSDNSLDSMTLLVLDSEKKQQNIAQDVKESLDGQNSLFENENSLLSSPYERVKNEDITNELVDELSERQKAKLTDTAGLEEINVQNLNSEGNKEELEISKSDDVVKQPHNKSTRSADDNLKSVASMPDEKEIQEMEVPGEELEKDAKKEVTGRIEKSVNKAATKDRNVSPYSRSELEQMYQDEIKLL